MITFSKLVRRLHKARLAAGQNPERPGHKYHQRIATGDPKRPWRYVYGVASGGRYIGHEDTIQTGARFAMGDGHLHITKREGDNVVAHDHLGQEHRGTVSEISAKLQKEHSAAIDQHQRKLKQDLADVMAYGSEKQKARFLTRAAAYGVVLDGGMGGYAPHEEVLKYGTDAHTLHKDALPEIKNWLDRKLWDFPNPNADEGMVSMRGHQIEGASRIIDAFKERDGFLLQDDAGLGKTVTALGALVGHGGRRNLVVVPAANKEDMMRSWGEAGRLFGLNIKHSSSAKAGEDGTFICSYDELYDGEDSDGRPKLSSHVARNWDVVAFDEAHNMANHNGVFGQSGVMLQGHTSKALYMTATPGTNIEDLHYLRKLGLFHDGESFVKWAVKAGARPVREQKVREGDGPRITDLPVNIKNPASPLPMVTIAAVMHVGGMSVKRQGVMRNVTSNFSSIPTGSVSPEHMKAFETGEQVRKLALECGVSPFNLGSQMSLWKRSMWEVAKTPAIVDMVKKAAAADPNSQHLVFYQYANHENHGGLQAMVNMAKKAKGPKDKIAKMEALIKTLPTENPLQKLIGDLGGHQSVAQIYGGAKSPDGKPLVAHEERNAYQRGEKRFAAGTLAKMSTGLSFHDTRGGRPRHQYVISTPYDAVTFQQEMGRSDRLGSKSPTTITHVLSSDPDEMRAGAVLGHRLQSMGALVAGQPDLHVTPGMLAAFDYAKADGDPEATVAGVEAYDTGEAPVDAAARMARDQFAYALDRLRKGGDPIEEEGAYQAHEYERKLSHGQRRAVAQMMMHGMDVHPHPSGVGFTVQGAHKGTTAHEHFRENAAITPGGATGYRPTYNKETGHWHVPDAKTFERIVQPKHMGIHEEKVPAVASLDAHGLKAGRLARDMQHAAGQGPKVKMALPQSQAIGTAEERVVRKNKKRIAKGGFASLVRTCLGTVR